jgi:hypothetical protein
LAIFLRRVGRRILIILFLTQEFEDFNKFAIANPLFHGEEVNLPISQIENFHFAPWRVYREITQLSLKLVDF